MTMLIFCSQRVLGDQGLFARVLMRAFQMYSLLHGAIKISDGDCGRLCFKKVLELHIEVNRSNIRTIQKA